MARFLTRTGIVHQLENIIKNAKKELILISPYINLDNNTKERIERLKRLKPRVNISVVYEKGKLRKGEREFFDSLDIKTTFQNNLHCKCYLNDDTALLTSMNLYEYSIRHNHEMGILVSRRGEWGDGDVYHDIYKEAMSLLGAANEHPDRISLPNGFKSLLKAFGNMVGTAKRETTPSPREWNRKQEGSNRANDSVNGFCLRCASEVPKNLKFPYCAKHFATWSEYNNKDFREKYCHICGN